jgi:selenide,water dikinase
MLRLNDHAIGDAHGCTDITGFGLLGHGRELALGSKVTLEIEAAAIEFLPGALESARQGALPGGLKSNRDFASPDVELTRDIAPEVEALLYDPQTSGGLLISSAWASPGRRIGRVLPFTEKAIRIV